MLKKLIRYSQIFKHSSNNHSSLKHYEITCCIEKCVGPDQLAFSEASSLKSTVFNRVYLFSYFNTVFTEFIYHFSTVRWAKLSSLCLICALGQVKFLWTTTLCLVVVQIRKTGNSQDMTEKLLTGM